ncbi:MAG: hypothetical protein R3F11_03535 [Verrucomicrobiales bacterium]
MRDNPAIAAVDRIAYFARIACDETNQMCKFYFYKNENPWLCSSGGCCLASCLGGAKRLGGGAAELKPSSAKVFELCIRIELLFSRAMCVCNRCNRWRLVAAYCAILGIFSEDGFSDFSAALVAMGET